MKKLNLRLSYFSKFEMILWCSSIFLIVASFILFDRKNYLTLTASVIGATSLMLNAKGNVVGQILIVIFGILYGIISFSSAYYGEMITYLGMTAPIAVLSVITWLKNPFDANKAQVKVNQLKYKEFIFLLFLSVAVTIVFYFILKALNTSMLLLSTISVFTSFVASYLTMRRSEYFAIGYAANDIVLIFLWIVASVGNTGYISMIICFVVFLANDLYGFINWAKIKKQQADKMSRM